MRDVGSCFFDLPLRASACEDRMRNLRIFSVSMIYFDSYFAPCAKRCDEQYMFWGSLKRQFLGKDGDCRQLEYYA